eukprot:CAMPEP_0182503510 /NCGR_PEP_ID=MMETSP1321-20130603/15436_1 /TAXON_ID=91990 /ORGANISM="Bolidomonas sp., Strain RCC1657" /LENGTH=100 /DNA_ID=CAMNT_0024708685 /DNA_START=117 /DNA_END=417 /DNA_ORIENTATION=+
MTRPLLLPSGYSFKSFAPLQGQVARRALTRLSASTTAGGGIGGVSWVEKWAAWRRAELSATIGKRPRTTQVLRPPHRAKARRQACMRRGGPFLARPQLLA